MGNTQPLLPCTGHHTDRQVHTGTQLQRKAEMLCNSTAFSLGRFFLPQHIFETVSVIFFLFLFSRFFTDGLLKTIFLLCLGLQNDEILGWKTQALSSFGDLLEDVSCCFYTQAKLYSLCRESCELPHDMRQLTQLQLLFALSCCVYLRNNYVCKKRSPVPTFGTVCKKIVPVGKSICLPAASCYWDKKRSASC